MDEFIEKSREFIKKERDQEISDFKLVFNIFINISYITLLYS